MEKFYRTISYKSDVNNAIALDMGLKIVASGTSSLLYQNLVEDEKIFSVVGGYFKDLLKERKCLSICNFKGKKSSNEIDNIIMNEFKIVDEKLTLKDLR